jgi:uncharacterized protein (UPF0264 family)
MAGLLVSVRSAAEARSALAGGATVIDVKEPDLGPLGRADVPTWRAVREVVPDSVPVSVALGELTEWDAIDPPQAEAWAGLSYRKLGLARAGSDWSTRWARLRGSWGPGPAWVAVTYVDWIEADSPHPEKVLDAALDSGCAGILVDTWTKGRPSPLDRTWDTWVGRARRGGLLVAIAGGLGAGDIARLAPLRPDLFAVRGAACAGGDRRGTIDPARVDRLARLAGSAARRGPRQIGRAVAAGSR